MLVIKRKGEEEVQIGENVTMKIIKVKGSVVTIGFDAPDDVKIFRMEVERKHGNSDDK